MIALFVIVIGAIWVRTFHYHEWLFFKWDQARDSILLAPAIEHGPEHLPLLGPRATKVGNDYLRLGPAYYYTQYVSGVVFSSTKPDVFAYPDLFFSILTIPLLYFFLRLYFSRTNALLAVLMYTFSFLIIQYSRFSWNPNSVPFFIILSFFGLLKFIESKKVKQRIGWIALWAGAFSIASQYHFFAFFSLTAITAIFVFLHYQLWKPKDIGSKIKTVFSKRGIAVALTAVFIIGVAYTPVIISDVVTDGSNVKNFIGAFSEKPKKNKTTWQKIVRNFREQPKHYYLLITSFRHRKGMKADPVPVGFGTVFVVLGLALTIARRKKEESAQKKAFLLLVSVWTIVFFLVTIPMSYQLRPRFFVVIFPIPYIFFGLWFVLFKEKFGDRAKPAIISIVAMILILNAYGTYAWFRENMLSQNHALDTGRTYILKKQDGVTLGQLEKVTDYMYENRRSDDFIYYSKPEYTISFKYLLWQKNDPLISYDFANSTQDLRGHDYVFAINSVSGGFDSVSKKIKDYATVISQKQFGQLVVFEMKIDQNKIPAPKEKKAVAVEEEEGKTERLFWRDVFGLSSKEVDSELGKKE
ncbi:MAG: glycosyltransferase family 39 protein [Patescibacteria group bacterium]|nr:glycosyltransferase family 39 protein [Patescibacteria group bacterium]